MKLLRPGVDDCALASVASFGINATSADTFAEDMASVTWHLSSPASWDAATESFTGVGNYAVCLSKDEGETWHQIPSKDALRLEVAGEDDDSSHPRKVFFAQRLSGRHGAKAALTLKGHRLRLPSTSAVRIAADCAAFDNTTETVRVNEAESSKDGYVFNVFADVEGHQAKVCYCDDQADDTAGNETTTTYRASTNQRCTPAAHVEADEAPNGTIAKADVAADFQAHFCQQKCSRGCVGADCYCDEYDPVEMQQVGAYGPLCVDPVLCRAACEATDGCAGFDFEPAKNFCWLYSECEAEEHEGVDSWAAQAGGACTDDADFAEVGTLDLTKRPFVDHDWVLEPGKESSIEVLGTDLNFHTDRIMIIDSTGTCGITGPTASARGDQHHYNHWVAKNAFYDPPASGEYPEPPEDPPADLVWIQREKSYCSGNNMPPWALAGVNAKHTCYAKCVKDAPCEGDDCFCDGLYPGYDKPDSAALCLDLAGCKAACTRDDNCFGIDMHSEKNRCFLNTAHGLDDHHEHGGENWDGDDEHGGENWDGEYGGENWGGENWDGMVRSRRLEEGQSCSEQVQLGQLASIDDYSFWFKHPKERRARKLERRDDRRLLAVEDGGLSWPQMLRFTGIEFATGGTFTACFCDSAVKDGSSVEVCKKPEDYTVQVGTVHVSGVECLLQHSKFQRGTCVNHHHPSGMRCYPGDAPEVEYPSPAAMAELVLPDADDTPAPSHLSSYCLYGPEEETRDNPLCQWPA